jgi:hypothetical protein
MFKQILETVMPTTVVLEVKTFLMVKSKTAKQIWP